MKEIITYARAIALNRHDDTRQEFARIPQTELPYLQALLDENRGRLWHGLRGWDPANATLECTDETSDLYGDAWHVRVEEKKTNA